MYYDNVLIDDTGPVLNSGQFTVDFGPGGSTNVVIVMNQGGNGSR